MNIPFYDTRINDDFCTILIKEREIAYEREKFDNPELVVEMMNKILQLNYAGEEYCYMATFNTKNRLLGLFLVSKGTINASLVSAREVFLRALLNGAVSIILIHNHPSKEVAPSREDMQLTKRIKEAGNLMGIELSDHIIIAGNSYFSMKEREML